MKRRKTPERTEESPEKALEPWGGYIKGDEIIIAESLYFPDLSFLWQFG